MISKIKCACDSYLFICGLEGVLEMGPSKAWSGLANLLIYARSLFLLHGGSGLTLARKKVVKSLTSR